MIPRTSTSVATGDTDRLGPWIKRLLAEEQTVAPVAQFAYESWQGLNAQERYYRNLIPLTAPEPGQQFAFEVDLDQCSGCKACVTACHRLNGLADGEVWRSVGQLMSAEPSRGFIQTVTTACHHCVDPGCLTGCPVLAYEKDSVTGIVRHLDDQCIGCQYCVLKCPYEVPQYNKDLGIVRKCDMCHDRLSEGEAPACVQGCPNAAIQIRIVDQATITNGIGPETRLVPGAALSSLTRPSTVYLSTREDNLALVPADEDSVVPEKTHWPLVWMLLLTQGSVGVWGFLALAHLVSEPLPSGFWKPAAVFASMIGFTGLAASILHLGKPTRAWRAFLGWRRSWLRREIIVFGGYASACTGSLVMPEHVPPLFVFGVGIAAVGASVMVYVDTGRPWWRLGTVAARFLGTVVSLGGVICLTVLLCTEFAFEAGGRQLAGTMAFGVALAACVKIVCERLVLRQPVHASARTLIRYQLAGAARCRVWGGLLGMVALFVWSGAVRSGYPMGNVLLFSALGAVFASEIAERVLFFRLALALSMPGGIRT